MDRGTVRAAADDPHRARLRAQGPRRPRADGHDQVMDLTRTTPRSHRRALPGIRRAEARTRPQDTWKDLSMTIVEFLLARIADDEAQANIDGSAAMTGYAWKGYSQDAYDELQRTTLKAAKRLHAECQAKRAIVDMHKPTTLEDLWGAARPDIAKNLVCEYDSSPDGHIGDTL